MIVSSMRTTPSLSVGRRVRTTARRVLNIRVIVNGETAAGRRLVTGMATFAQHRPDWHLHLDFNPLRIAAHDDAADATLFGSCDAALARRFQSHGRPLVGCLAHVEPLGVPVVRSDDRTIGDLAARYFLERGFERFVFDSMNDRSPAAGLRWEGFDATVRAAGFTAVWRTEAAVVDPLSASVLRGGIGPVAVMTGHDGVGRELMRVLADSRIAIPDEVALLGVDDDEFLCVVEKPTLSSIAIPYERIGHRAAEILSDLLSGGLPPPTPILVPPIGVTTRESTDIVCVDDPRLARALRMIREHACDPCDVSQIALQAGVSRRWLEKEFRKRYNRSPFDAILRVRMDRAKVLLQDPLITLKNIASACGYSHAQNFVSAFRQAAGETPGEHRRRLFG